MTKIKEYLSNPAVRFSFFAFVFWLGITYATFDNRISNIEQWKSELDLASIQTQLSNIQTNIAQIQTDIEWIKKKQ